MGKLAAEELAKIDIIDLQDVRDSVVVRMAKTYPAYFGTYERFQEVRDYVDAIPNLFLVGRNGMHKYNNQDHSMLTAMTAVDNIIAGRRDKQNLWEVNTEQDYHETKEEVARDCGLRGATPWRLRTRASWPDLSSEPRKKLRRQKKF